MNAMKYFLTVFRERRTMAIALLFVGLLLLPVSGFGDERTEEVILGKGDQPQELEVLNLSGQMSVKGWDGPSTRVRVTFHAEDSGGLTAAQILQLVEARAEVNDNRLTVTTALPLDRYDRFFYPGKTLEHQSLQLASSETCPLVSDVRYDGERVQLFDSPRRGALAVWADYTILVPEGTQVSLRNISGTLSAENVQGNILLDTGRGDVVARDTGGSLSVDAARGNVNIRQFEGDNLILEASAGDVFVQDVYAARFHAESSGGGY